MCASFGKCNNFKCPSLVRYSGLLIPPFTLWHWLVNWLFRWRDRWVCTGLKINCDWHPRFSEWSVVAVALSSDPSPLRQHAQLGKLVRQMSKPLQRPARSACYVGLAELRRRSYLWACINAFVVRLHPQPGRNWPCPHILPTDSPRLPISRPRVYGYNDESTAKPHLIRLRMNLITWNAKIAH